MTDQSDIENRIDIDAFIDGLPTRKRFIARLYREGMNQAEISKAMKLTRGRISQIISEFRTDIEDYL